MTDVPHVFPDSSPAGEESVHNREALRAALRAAADRTADYLCGLGERPIFPADPTAPAGELLPAAGEDLQALFADAADWAVDNSIHVGHPGYAGHMDSGVGRRRRTRRPADLGPEPEPARLRAGPGRHPAGEGSWCACSPTAPASGPAAAA